MRNHHHTGDGMLTDGSVARFRAFMQRTPPSALPAPDRLAGAPHPRPALPRREELAELRLALASLQPRNPRPAQVIGQLHRWLGALDASPAPQPSVATASMTEPPPTRPNRALD